MIDIKSYELKKIEEIIELNEQEMSASASTLITHYEQFYDDDEEFHEQNSREISSNGNIVWINGKDA